MFRMSRVDTCGFFSPSFSLVCQGVILLILLKKINKSMTIKRFIFIYLNDCNVFLINFFLFPSWSRTFGLPLWTCYVLPAPDRQAVRSQGKSTHSGTSVKMVMYFGCQWLYSIFQVLDINKFCIILLACDYRFFPMILTYISCAYIGAEFYYYFCVFG